MSTVFKYQTKVMLYHVDAAGKLFYGQLFFIIHEAFSTFLDEIGFSIKDRLKLKDFFFPIVHAEANYSAPLSVGDVLEVKLSIEKIKVSSFVVSFDLSSNNKRVGDAKIVHACLSGEKGQKIDIPSALKKSLEKFLSEKTVLV